MLCDLLTETGVAGRPNSFFRRQSYAEWADYLGVPTQDWSADHEFDAAYLAAAIKEGAAETDVLGIRLMWESLRDLSDRLDTFYPNLQNDNARFRAAFGQPVYIHLSRSDKVAQAVSRLKAEQSGVWHRFTDGSERERLSAEKPLVYNADVLAAFVQESTEDDAAWKSWFTEQGIEPACVTYEEMSAEPQKILARVLSALALDPAIAETIEPISAVLADDESRDWADQFRRERC